MLPEHRQTGFLRALFFSFCQDFMRSAVLRRALCMLNSILAPGWHATTIVAGNYGLLQSLNSSTKSQATHKVALECCSFAVEHRCHHGLCTACNSCCNRPCSEDVLLP